MQKHRQMIQLNSDVPQLMPLPQPQHQLGNKHFYEHYCQIYIESNAMNVD